MHNDFVEIFYFFCCARIFVFCHFFCSILCVFCFVFVWFVFSIVIRQQSLCPIAYLKFSNSLNADGQHKRKPYSLRVLLIVQCSIVHLREQQKINRSQFEHISIFNRDQHIYMCAEWCAAIQLVTKRQRGWETEKSWMPLSNLL